MWLPKASRVGGVRRASTPRHDPPAGSTDTPAGLDCLASKRAERAAAQQPSGFTIAGASATSRPDSESRIPIGSTRNAPRMRSSQHDRWRSSRRARSSLASNLPALCATERAALVGGCDSERRSETYLGVPCPRRKRPPPAIAVRPSLHRDDQRYRRCGRTA
jgi:hypothetical protein